MDLGAWEVLKESFTHFSTAHGVQGHPIPSRTQLIKQLPVDALQTVSNQGHVKGFGGMDELAALCP